MLHIINRLRYNTNDRPESQFAILPDGRRGNRLWVDNNGNVLPSTDRGLRPPNAVGYYILRKSMLDDIGTSLFTQNTGELMPFAEATISKFTSEINAAFSKYGITTCIRKIHFLAQAYVETQWFTKTYETNPNSSVSGGAFYRGRGLIQLSHDYNYRAYFNFLFQREPSSDELRIFIPKVAQEMRYACDASGYYWRYKGVAPGTPNISVDADRDDVLRVSQGINGYVRAPYAIDDRRKYTSILKEIMRYEECINKR
jgi:predicted chitinase